MSCITVTGRSRAPCRWRSSPVQGGQPCPRHRGTLWRMSRFTDHGVSRRTTSPHIFIAPVNHCLEQLQPEPTGIRMDSGSERCGLPDGASGRGRCPPGCRCRRCRRRSHSDWRDMRRALGVRLPYAYWKAMQPLSRSACTVASCARKRPSPCATGQKMGSAMDRTSGDARIRVRQEMHPSTLEATVGVFGQGHAALRGHRRR